jgi:hypothetical protein
VVENHKQRKTDRVRHAHGVRCSVELPADWLSSTSISDALRTRASLETVNARVDQWHRRVRAHGGALGRHDGAGQATKASLYGGTYISPGPRIAFGGTLTYGFEQLGR